MRYSLPELVQASGYPVDTIRYYQSLGLLHSPEHDGRRAVYEEAHLDRLKLVRSMSRRGLSLRVIGMLLERGGKLDSDQALVVALEEEASEPSYSSAELARQLDLPEGIVASIEGTGIAETAAEKGEERRYSEADLRAARGAIKLLRYGFPLTRLLALAVKHDRAVRRVVDEAIDLFDEYVRKRGSGRAEDQVAVARAFREILPTVTALVVHHFQRVLINRALKRLRRSGGKSSLEYALEVASKAQLGVRWQ